MNIAGWLARRVSPETRFGESIRRVYRRFSPRVERAWTEVFHGLAASKKDVRFVQIGSNDSGYGDPLRFHILKNGWTGLLIEPLPHIFARLQSRCSGLSGLTLENVAIDVKAGERPFFHLRPSDEPGLPPWYDMLGSFLEENVLKHEQFLPGLAERLISTPVQCVTFDEVCARNGIARFDVLHIDAEGYDYEILRKVDLLRYRPTIVLYESAHLSDSDYADSLAQLHAAGMLTHSDAMDTIAVAKIELTMHKPLLAGWRFLRNRARAGIDESHSGSRAKHAAAEKAVSGDN